MDYENIYKTLCSSRKWRGTSVESGFEVHHITPRCMGGGDGIENLVKLTHKEHIFAHKLLVKIYDSPKLKIALYLMQSVRKNGRGDYTKLSMEKGNALRQLYLEERYRCHENVTILPNLTDKFEVTLSEKDYNAIDGVILDINKTVTPTRFKAASLLWRFLLFCSDNNVTYISSTRRVRSYHTSILNKLCENGYLSVVKSSKIKSYKVNPSFYETFDVGKRPVTAPKCRYAGTEYFVNPCSDGNDGKYLVLPWILNDATLESLIEIGFQPRKRKEIQEVMRKAFIHVVGTDMNCMLVKEK